MESSSFRPPAPTPRDKPLDVIGFLAALRRNPLETWTQAHFNDMIVMRETIVGRRAVINEPDAIRRVLVDNAVNYRKDDLQRRILAPGLGDGLLTAEGAQWREQRRAIASLFTPKTVGSFVPRWLRRPGSFVTTGCGFATDGAPMSRSTWPRNARRAGADDLFRWARTRSAGLCPPRHPLFQYDRPGRSARPPDFPDWIPRIGRIRGRGAVKFFDDAVHAIIAVRRKRLVDDPDSVPRDLLTLLLEASDPGTGIGLSEAEIRANIMTFIGAGHETTANTLTWTLFLLASAPDVRAALEAEIDQEFAEGTTMTAAVLDRLVKTRAVIDEALRLYPPAAILSRSAIDADDLVGARIRAGTVVVVAPWVLHRHRLLWDEPDAFKPWRFLPGAREKIPRFSYLPFGAGPRVCIGASFALQEAVIILATILQSFRLELMAGHGVKPVQRVTLRPEGGMPMLIRRRGGHASASPQNPAREKAMADR